MSDGDLPKFIEAAGRSFADAQASLVGQSIQTRLAISEAELEVKAALQTTDSGLQLQTISTADIRQGGVQPAALSTLKVRFVALGEPAAPAPATAPVFSKEEVVDQVASRPDLAVVKDLFDHLNIDPVFVPERSRWLVTVKDPEGRTLRELVVPDERADT